MRTLIVVIALATLVAGAYLIYRIRAARRSEVRDEPDAPRPNQELGAPTRDVTLDTLQPGDVLVFWSGGDAIVEAVLECREELLGRTTAWRWLFLDSGQLLELAPDGRSLFGAPQLFAQGSPEFDALTADVGHQGLLKTFEARVRAGTAASNPVLFTHQGTPYRIRSTGTFAATSQGKPLQLEAWRDVSPQATDNVYFELEGMDGRQALGIWTTHIVFHVGRALDEADLKGVYGR